MLAWINKSAKRQRLSPEETSNTENAVPVLEIVSDGELSLVDPPAPSSSALALALAPPPPPEPLTLAAAGATATTNTGQSDAPDCWTTDQVQYFCKTNAWLLLKDKKLGCRICRDVKSLGIHTGQGLKLSTEWGECAVSHFGVDKGKQQASLRKKIKEHKESQAHVKAADILTSASRETIQHQVQSMHKSELDTTIRVFRTAYKIGKHSRPFTDMPIDLNVQKLNGLNVGRVLHSNKTCGEIIDHIAHELKKKMAKDITENQRKLCVLVDESTTISGKTVLVVCLRSALADAEPETFFWELIELDGTTADDITKALMECLGRDFNEDFLGQCFVSFACDGASVMLGKRTGVATQLCSKFPSLFVWHCSNHRLELAVGDVVKEVSGLNHFQIFFDKLYSLFHASPKNQRQLAQCAQAVGQRLLVIGRVLSIRWVASSERSVRAVWENYRVLHDHFTNAANDTSRDSRDRAKYKGLDDVLTSATFVSNLGLMYDALTELSDLSRQLQKREMTLPTADRLLTREIRVFESMVTMPGPHMTTVHTALAEKSFKGVALRENGRLVQIHAGQFFRSMVENLRHRMTSTTSSHVSTREIPLHGREARDNQLIQDMKVIHPGSWPEEELDVQYGDVEVLRLCEVLKVDRRETVQGFREYKETRASRTPAAMEPLLKAVRTIAVSTSECERAFSCMNDILTAKRNALSVSRLSSLVFIKCNGPSLGQFNPEQYVRSWLAKGRRSADERACPAPAPDTDVPKAFWSLF